MRPHSSDPERSAGGQPNQTGAQTQQEPAEPKVVVRDRRRIDPATGALRPPADLAESQKPAQAEPDTTSKVADSEDDKPGQELAETQAKLAERTADLQRVSAEYANYRRRSERERIGLAEQATAIILTGLLPVLDDVERARSHNDLTGAFGAVAEQLLATLAKLGLTAFGEPGDAFDPEWHEAVAHSVSSDVTEATCVEILRKGYALGDKMLRPALVAVAEPASDTVDSSNTEVLPTLGDDSKIDRQGDESTS